MAGAVRGLSISGGEPFEQPEGLAALCEAAQSRGWDVLVFTGFTRAQLRAAEDPAVARALAVIDMLVAGPYQREQAIDPPVGLRTSANQRLHELTGRIGRDEVRAVPGAEVILGLDGSVCVSGPASLRL